MKHLVWWLLAASMFGTLLSVQAQPTTEKPVTNTYPFEDGIYVQYADFQKNKPSVSLRNLSSFRYETDRERNKVLVAKSTLELFKQQGLDMTHIWGLCINQTPYIRVQPDSSTQDICFMRLYVLGELSYFYYREMHNEEVVMSIYNPVTQKKIAQKPITNKRKITVEKMFHFEDGILLDYNEANLGDAIRKDEKLYKTWQDANKPINSEQLFKYLLIYNERNPIYFLK